MKNIGVGSLIVIGGNNNPVVEWAEKAMYGLSSNFEVVEVVGGNTFKVKRDDGELRLIDISDIWEYKGFKIGGMVELKKDIVFDYGTVAYKGDFDTIDKVDSEGIWLKRLDICIEHGFEGDFLKDA